ncbi:MAG: ParB/RepB/Spo0J family partition protein [Litorimonas sp.]
MSGRKKGLGRGLSALMSDAGLNEVEDTVKNHDNGGKTKTPIETKSAVPNSVENLVDSPKEPDTPREQPRVLNVAISRLVRNAAQPRKVFERDKLDDLIASIQQTGVLQPILVRQIDSQTASDGADFQIVAGERRWRAAIKAGLTSIPIIIRNLSDRDVLEIGVIENVQRADLNPLEEALAYERLIKEFGRTQADIATSIGKSRVHVANTVRLTGLTERGRELLMGGKITAGHARALLAATDPDALAEAIIKNDWTVRQAESWVRDDKSARNPGAAKPGKPADIKALEQRIRDTIGYAADIRHGARGGEIRLKYKDLDHMEALLSRMGLLSS